MPRCCLLAEIGAALRICGAVTSRAGQPAVEAGLAGYPQAARLRAAIAAAFGYQPLIQARPGGRDPRCLLVAATGGQAETLIRTAGLTDPAGRPLAGMPQPVVAGRRCDCAASWRGAFLAAGFLCLPDRARPVLTVACPSLEAALALAGTARRIGITAQARDYRGGGQVCVAGEDGITALLRQIGGTGTAAEWGARRADCQARGTIRPVTAALNREELDGSNLTRSRRAAAEAALRARRALDILGAGTPGDLQAAGRLRIAHPDAQLHQLGQMASPPLSKDTIAGRLRRLNRLADARAAELGIPGTEDALAALAG
jgi:DNA-binding protein WhiA